MSAHPSHQATSSKPAKTAHYTSALSSALLRGAWADNHAGKDAKGYDVSWVELVRKWGKHTGGNTAIIHHLRDISLLYLSSHSSSHPSSSGYITISTPPPQTHTRDPSSPRHPADAALHSSSSSAEAGSSQSGSGSSFIHVPHLHLRRSRSKPSVDIPRSGTQAAASVGGSTVRGAAAFLSPADLDGDEPEDEIYWAEGSGWWHGVGVDQVDEVKDGIRALESGLTGKKMTEGDLQSSRLLLAYHYHAIGEHDKALRTLDSVDWLSDPKIGMNGGDAAVLERIRGRCLQGMSTELLHPSSPSPALQAYLETIPLVASIFPSPSPAYLSSSTSAASAQRIPFEPNRELHRWLSTSLCRSAVSSSRQPNALTQTLRILRTYHAYASSWPTSFRPAQRRRMLLLYLTALATAYSPSHASAESPYLLFPSETSLSARAAWRKEVLQAIREGQQLLSQTTSFPRAGVLNIPVRRFTDLCVALADCSPSLTVPVIDVLWWSMTLTFQSQSVLRHLTRLLHRKGMDTDAKRTFELYVKLVLKSRETAHPESSMQLEDHPTDDPTSSPVQPTQEVQPTADKEEREEEVKEAEEEAEIDGDEVFVKALLVGVRVFCRELGDLEEGWRYACLAREVVRKTEGGWVGQAVRAEVEEVLGIVRMTMASTGADPISRPTYQAQSINHLLTATKLSPNSATTFFHLSYAQAEARAIDDAIQSIRTSLELDSENVQAWHLLALLLTARQDWEGARKACEAGIAVWEVDEQATASEEDDEEASAGGNVAEGVETRDFAISSSTSQPLPTAPTPSHPLLSPTGQLLPLAPALPPKNPRSRKLHNVIRLRMTLNVIIEKTSGPELAMLGQQELFAFFSARSGEGRKSFGYGQGSGRGGLGSMPSVGSVGGLGGSYVSIAGTAGPGSVVNVQPATPAVTQGYSLDPPPQITHSSASSPGNTTPEGDHSDDDGAVETLTRDFAETGSIKEKNKEGRKSLHLGSRKGLAKHLHVPGVKSVGKGRPSSVRRLTDGASGSEGDLANRNRTASASSAALSMAPTAVHSHYHGTTSAHPAVPPTAPPVTAALPTHGRTPGESRMLSNLWLMSAATFRRWGKPDQCLVAINEAELLDPENAEVWIQLGLYHSSSPSSLSSGATDLEKALSAYTKAIILRPSHPSGLVHLARLYLSTNQVELAHSILNQVTQDNGWDSPEAWVALARACKAQGRDMRERECLIYALGLEETRSARGLREAVDRWL